MRRTYNPLGPALISSPVGSNPTASAPYSGLRAGNHLHPAGTIGGLDADKEVKRMLTYPLQLWGSHPHRCILALEAGAAQAAPYRL
jgi:hypothetical protein